MEFQKSLGRESFDLEQGNISAKVIKHELRGRSYLYIPYGPDMDFNSMTGGMDNNVRQFIAELKSLAQREQSVFVKTEPMVDSAAQALVRHGFKKTNKEVHPH